MNKLTSSDISWFDGDKCAVVSSRDNVMYLRFSSDPVGCESGFRIGNHSFNTNEFYVVERDGDAPELKSQKTVIDAVNFFSGEFPLHDMHDTSHGEEMSQIIEAQKEFNGCLTGDLSNGNSVSSNQYWSVICTIEEFNKKVDELSAHGGVINLNYYLEGDKEPLTVDNSDYSTLENAAEAKQVQAKPIYTKTMKDAGELPSVGMQVQGYDDGEYVECEILHHKVNSAGIDVFAVMSRDGRLFWTADLKTIGTETPEQKAQISLVSLAIFNSKYVNTTMDAAKKIAQTLQEHGHLAEVDL